MTQNPTPDPFAQRADDDAVPYYEAPTTSYEAPTTSHDTPSWETPTYTAPTYPEQPTTVLPAPSGVPAEDEPATAPLRRGTSDLGLLLLRVGLGVVLLGHGAQKLFALFEGPGINGFQSLLTGAGYRHPQLLAYVGSISEVGAGLFLVLGLLTPLAGAAALGTTINAWFVADLAGPGFHYFVADSGQEYELLLVVLSAVVVLVGPGRYALDRGRGWATRPLLSSWFALVLGIASGLLVWFLLNGATPFA